MTEPIVLPFRGIHPRIHPSVYLAPGAAVLGDVEIGEDCTIWFGTVIRGDVFHIRIGQRTNVQDGTVIHVTTDTHPTLIHDDVTIGHRVVLHGCTVHSHSLIGINAVVLDRAVVGPRVMVAAGSVVIPGTVLPEGTMAMGSPAKVKRNLTQGELDWLTWAPAHYVEVGRSYRDAR